MRTARLQVVAPMAGAADRNAIRSPAENRVALPKGPCRTLCYTSATGSVLKYDRHLPGICMPAGEYHAGQDFAVRCVLFPAAGRSALDSLAHAVHSDMGLGDGVRTASAGAPSDLMCALVEATRQAAAGRPPASEAPRKFPGEKIRVIAIEPGFDDALVAALRVQLAFGGFTSPWAPARDGLTILQWKDIRPSPTGRQ